MPQTEEKVIELIKAMPRRPLDERAASGILQRLNEAEERLDRRRLRFSRAFVPASAAVLIAALLLLPYLADQAKQQMWVARLFPPTQPSADWTVSPKFDLLDKDGSIIYPHRVVGIEGRIGFMDSDFAANAPEPGSKIFWYVWGDPDKLRQAHLVATAVNRETGAMFTLDESTLQGPIYGADAHAVTAFKVFPRKGLWRVDVTIDGQPYGSIVVPVKDEYVRTVNARFHLSKDDVKTGKMFTTFEVLGKSDEHSAAIEVRAYPVHQPNKASVFRFDKGQSFIRAGLMKPVTFYEGQLQFDAPGLWAVEVLGERTVVEVKPR